MNAQFSVAMLACGKGYQIAAAMTAATYRINCDENTDIAIFIPSEEAIRDEVSFYSSKYALKVIPFDNNTFRERRSYANLKCRAFCEMLKHKGPDVPLLIVDADTYCVRRPFFPDETISKISAGCIGLARDIVDRHPDDETLPWFVPINRRLPYVNTGVILTCSAASDMFRTFAELAKNCLFVDAPFCDQTIINFALASHFAQRFVGISDSFNAIHSGEAFLQKVTIGHLAGGIGELNAVGNSRLHIHQSICRAIIDGNLGDM